jgi:restriction system protein
LAEILLDSAMAYGEGAYGELAYGEGARRRVRLPADPPAIVLKAVLDFGGRTDDGRLVGAVRVPWFEIVKMLQEDPASAYQIGWEKWEEIIAGAYKRQGFDEVILTPRSGDKGRDVIATKWGVGSIRFFDQIKAYSPGHLVNAEEVRAMIGVINGAGNVSKGIITTTSGFAPRVTDDVFIKPFIPYRLELKPCDDLLDTSKNL